MPEDLASHSSEDDPQRENAAGEKTVEPRMVPAEFAAFRFTRFPGSAGPPK